MDVKTSWTFTTINQIKIAGSVEYSCYVRYLQGIYIHIQKNMLTESIWLSGLSTELKGKLVILWEQQRRSIKISLHLLFPPTANTPKIPRSLEQQQKSVCLVVWRENGNTRKCTWDFWCRWATKASSSYYPFCISLVSNGILVAVVERRRVRKKLVKGNAATFSTLLLLVVRWESFDIWNDSMWKA